MLVLDSECGDEGRGTRANVCPPICLPCAWRNARSCATRRNLDSGETEAETEEPGRRSSRGGGRVDMCSSASGKAVSGDEGVSPRAQRLDHSSSRRVWRAVSLKVVVSPKADASGSRLALLPARSVKRSFMQVWSAMPSPKKWVAQKRRSNSHINSVLNGPGVLGGVWIPVGGSTSEERMRTEMHSLDSVRGPLR